MLRDGARGGLQVLRSVFFHPEDLRPGVTTNEVTEDAAQRIAALAQRLRDRGLDPHPVARFLDRIVFCLFAEDIGLLPDGLFTQILARRKDEPDRFARTLTQLFDAMAHGGDFGVADIRHFDGDLFADAAVLDLLPDEIDAIHLTRIMALASRGGAL